MLLLFASYILLAGESRMHFVKASVLPRSGWFGLFEDDRSASIRRTAVRVQTIQACGEAIQIDSTPKGAGILFHSVPGIPSSVTLMEYRSGRIT